MARGRGNGLLSPLAGMTRRSIKPGNRDRAVETAHPYTFPHGNSALAQSPGMTRNARRGVSHALGPALRGQPRAQPDMSMAFSDRTESQWFIRSAFVVSCQ
jgi:hypothetical protein